MFHYNSFTLNNGYDLLSRPNLCDASPLPDFPSTYKLIKVIISGENTLKYDFLREVYEYEKQLSESFTCVSPLSALALPLDHENLPKEDFEKIDRYILRVLNHDCNRSLVKFFFNNVIKMNHLIRQAEELFLYIIYDPNQVNPQNILPEYNRVSDVRYLNDEIIAPEFAKYYNFIAGNRPRLNYAIYSIKALQCLLLLAYIVYVYLCISNSHKIRSTLGLVIGWVISVFISSLASVGLVNLFTSSLYWPDVVGATNWISTGFFVFIVMLFSSRNLFRTINDLAGDSTFGAPENIHKRLIKFYLGINNSIVNSQGVYHLSRILRKYLFVDRLANLIVPIPNTSVILLINSVGSTFIFAFLVTISGYLLQGNTWSLYLQGAIDSYITFLAALLIDHFLQLSFIVGIIIIDLNRIDLTDLMNHANILDEESSFLEVNQISAFLFGKKRKASKTSWRYRLGTFFLKVGQASLSSFWGCVLPITFAVVFLTIGIVAKLIIPNDLSRELIELLNFNSTKMLGQTNNFLYYSELFAVVIFIIAISELTFVLTYSKRQRRHQDYSTVLIPTSTDMTISDLLINEKKKLFECITLNGASKADILKLNANTRCPLLVSTDINHNVLVWTPSRNSQDLEPIDISTVFGSHDVNAKVEEYWPINHIELSDNGFFIVLINYNRCRLKCYDRRKCEFVWEVSLTSELTDKKRMNAVATFYRKKTVAGFLARKLLLKQQKSHMRRGSNVSLMSSQISGNYPPPHPENSSEDQSSGSNLVQTEKDKGLHRDEFCMILESGEMITISCDTVKIKVYNILRLLYEEESTVKIISLKLLKTARVNDRVVCNLSNDEIVIGTAVNNVWRFNKLELNINFNTQPQVAYAPPLMKRSGMASPEKDSLIMGSLERQKHQSAPRRLSTASTKSNAKFPPINKSHIVSIDFVGMFVRVQNLHAELIDIMTGTILKVFHIGSFKPGSFRVAHSEPLHCKFCGCASVESISILYEDFYDKTLIVHSYTIENKKSRSNICLRVERDPREVRCLGFDSVIEQQYWYEDVEKWELTDMNVIMGIKKATELPLEGIEKKSVLEFTSSSTVQGLSTLRSRKKLPKTKGKIKKNIDIKDLWQGFVITVNNGKLLNYNIPNSDEPHHDFSCARPNFIMKYGYKAIAIAFGATVKILYLGGDHLIENDLYYSGTTSSLNQILRPGNDAKDKNKNLLFISKRRNILEQKRMIRPTEATST